MLSDFSLRLLWNHVLICTLLEVLCVEELEALWVLEELEDCWSDWTPEALEAVQIERQLGELEFLGNWSWTNLEGSSSK